MNRKIAVFAAALAAFAFVGQSAHARSRGLAHAINPFDGPVNTGGTIAGGAMTATYFGINHWRWKWDSAAAGISQAGAITLTTIGCAALSPMIASVLANRPLTYREADGLVVGCVIPIIGPMLVDALYDAHPEWPHGQQPVKAHYVKRPHYRHHRRHR